MVKKVDHCFSILDVLYLIVVKIVDNVVDEFPVLFWGLALRNEEGSRLEDLFLEDGARKIEETEEVPQRFTEALTTVVKQVRFCNYQNKSDLVHCLENGLQTVGHSQRPHIVASLPEPLHVYQTGRVIVPGNYVRDQCAGLVAWFDFCSFRPDDLRHEDYSQPLSGPGSICPGSSLSLGACALLLFFGLLIGCLLDFLLNCE